MQEMHMCQKNIFIQKWLEHTWKFQVQTYYVNPRRHNMSVSNLGLVGIKKGSETISEPSA